MSQSVQFKDLLASLRKSPNQRSLEDVLIIKNYLMTIQFLKDSFKGQEQSFEQLSKMFRLEIFDEDQTIFHIDSKGDKYYLILQGQVGIYIRPPKQISKGETKLKLSKKKDDQTQDNKLDKNKDSRKDVDEKEESLQFKKNNHLDSLIMVKQLQEGQTFGEMALIYNQPRLATIHTFQETILAVLTKRDFRLIMKKAEMRQIKGELKFLKQVYLFQSWSYENLRDIYLNSEQVQLQIGQNVFKEDDPADSIYIIKRGSFLLSKQVQLANTQSNVDGLIKNQNLIGKIGQLGECDVFGEEEFVSLINLIFKENDYDENSYFDQQNQQLEQFIFENQKTNRFSTVTCDSREGGTLIRIKINDYLLRILNYSETRKIALNSIKQKIALHSQVHERNCETFVFYQKYLIRGDPQFFKNPLSSMVCQNAIYSNNATIDQPNYQGINSERKKGISPIESPIFSESVTITKDLKQNNKKNQSSQERNQNGRVSSRANNKYSNQVKSNENLDNLTIQASNQVKNSSQKQKLKKYKFQFISEQCDDSIFTEKIPENLKQIHKERQKQKYEAMQIYKYEQTNYQKVQLNHFKNKYNQNEIPYYKQNAYSKSIEPIISNKIAKLGYKVIKLKDQEIENQNGEYYSIEDHFSNQQTQRNEISNLMQITSCGDNWINSSSIDQKINLNSHQMQKTKNKFPMSKQNTGKSKIEGIPQIREYQKIRLRPLIIDNQINSTCKNLSNKNSFDFNNFYNGKLDQGQNQSLTDSIYNNISLQITPKKQHFKSNNQSLDHKQHLNKSYDIYHPVNLSKERNQNNSRDWKSRQQYVNSLLNEFQSKSISFNKIKLLNCQQIAPVVKLQGQNSPQDHQKPLNNKIQPQSKRRENLFQLKCITDSI
ncbi:cyclic nucleotide-binding domain protein (macronuclear) [Tetrahymena thermophila SB210]|uniref:Cyclic nucleotide-binding domain protein n=1 Tax=Tetrahymena thermophila (strain SB210) TaxID=312017 RepID=Q248A3_TETTS|nr:cyclic nucleotide-binding domain protein [Tetrahymena thermophila SB210]EAS04142.2 cyclic nucleotide-binding domain protein [Tetrahymena thermophila SB210]|eukprot:XP_001024387.2 cyclic nucleotide-binding domain protein [Tetrahymena thermophila SB210]